MLKKTSKAFGVLFLIEFTKEVLKHSKTYDVQTLEAYLMEKAKRDLEKRKQLGLEDSTKLRSIIEKKEVFESPKEFIRPIPKPFLLKEFKEPKKMPHSPLNLTPRPVRLMSVEPNQPEREKGLLEERKIPGFITRELRVHIPPEGVSKEVKPVPTAVKIDLGKINQLINDPTILSIECNGPDTNLIIKRPKERRMTEVTLNLEEINEVIRAFSEKSKIPVQEGTFRVAVGKLVISATVSETPKFVITKMFAF